MTKRRIKKSVCVLFVIINVYLYEWLASNMIGKPNNVEVVISAIIYTYISILACMDLFYVLDGDVKYLKKYHFFSFLKEIALTNLLFIVLTLIFGIFHNAKMNPDIIIPLIMTGVIDLILIIKANERSKKYI